MIGVVVATHGNLAGALLETARSVVPAEGQVAAVEIRQEDDAQSFEVRFADAVRKVASAGGVLVLTDMFGGTPSNIGMTLHERDKVEVLTGVNLPMIIKVLQLMRRPLDLTEVARQARDSAVRSIAIASDMLAGVATTTEKTA